MITGIIIFLALLTAMFLTMEWKRDQRERRN